MDVTGRVLKGRWAEPSVGQQHALSWLRSVERALLLGAATIDDVREARVAYWLAEIDARLARRAALGSDGQRQG